MSNDIIPLFGVPLFVGYTNPVPQETKKHIYDLAYQRTISDTAYISVDRQVLNDPKFLDLKKEVHRKLDEYVRDVLHITNDINFEMVNSWVMKMEQNDYAPIHPHDNSVISGCMYIDCDSYGGKLQFYRRNSSRLFAGVQYKHSDFNVFNSDSWFIQPAENMISFFPSDLGHDVSRNESNKTRYSLAFDFYHRGTLFRDKFGMIKI